MKNVITTTILIFLASCSGGAPSPSFKQPKDNSSTSDTTSISVGSSGDAGITAPQPTPEAATATPSPTATVKACAGKLIDGICWYVEPGYCGSICANRGGVDTANLNYFMSSSVNRCKTILDAFDVSRGTPYISPQYCTNAEGGHGCEVWSNQRYTCDKVPIEPDHHCTYNEPSRNFTTACPCKQ